jgi:hypothetical protein
MLGLLLLVFGCGENATPTKADRSESQRPATRAQPDEDPSQAGRAPRSIPGMDADAVAAVFLKPGLECYEPVDRDVLYACSSEEEDDVPLVYGGRITGGGDLVSTVEARVIRKGSEDFDLASRPYFGLLGTQLEYRGANKKRAYGFVSRNLDSAKANTTIGAAEWTMTTSRDRKTLVVAPAQ